MDSSVIASWAEAAIDARAVVASIVAATMDVRALKALRVIDLLRLGDHLLSDPPSIKEMTSIARTDVIDVGEKAAQFRRAPPSCRH